MGCSAPARRRTPATCCTGARRLRYFGVNPSNTVTAQATGTWLDPELPGDWGQSRRRSPTPRGRLGLGVPAGSPPAAASCPRRSQVRLPAKQRCFRGAPLPSPDAPPSRPLPGPQQPGCQPGAGRRLGGRCRGRRPRREGQTGGAGTGTASPRVNSAGPCSPFKALNRGRYRSSPEFGAGGMLERV